MADREKKRYAVSTFTGALVALALIGLIGLLGGAGGVAGEAVEGSWAWAAPLLAGAVVGGVAWALMADPMPDGDDELSATIQCDACGGPVLAEWRLCPHCGEIIGDVYGGDCVSAHRAST